LPARPSERPDAPSLRQLSSLAYERLRQAIIECDLAPGTAVSQSKLESTFGLGKAAVRTALARLNQNGLVEAFARRGYVVSPVTIKNIDDLLGLRLLLEPEATRLACGKLSTSELARLKELAEVGYTTGDKDSERQFLRANREFHLMIAQASGNERLASMLGQIIDEAMRMLYMTMSSARNLTDDWCDGHRQIYEALRLGNGDVAGEIVKKEIISARTEIFDIVLRSAAISKVNVFAANPVRKSDSSKAAD
jgi:DNA-binding GntR family transcriptional regulator